MNKCKRCGKENPAEIHTCTAGYHFSEHEKLKQICDEINFELTQNNFGYINVSKKIIHITDKDNKNQGPTLGRVINVREIIFTPEFIDKIMKVEQVKYILNNGFQRRLLEHLDDPVSYLYSLIKND